MGIFASEPSATETAVHNATDEALISEDWAKIIAVCDLVSDNPSKNGPDAVKALKARLQTNNGNVQLYSLTLLNALAQNCGPIPQREIAAHPMASTLNKIGVSSSTHRSVLVRLVEILGQLSEQFSSEPGLKQIEKVYERVLMAHPDLKPATSSAASSHYAKPSASASRPYSANSYPPEKTGARSAPQNNEEEEDEDLKRALELSLQDMHISSAPNAGPSAPSASSANNTSRPRHFVKALYDFVATEDGELTFKQGDIVEVLDRVYKEWWKGVLNHQEGIFPVNYVEDYEPVNAVNPVQQPGSVIVSNQGVSNTPPPQAPVTITEEYIFAQVAEVNKLLSILQGAVQSGDGSSIITNEDVQHMYHQISAMRPKLVQLIDEYTTKKQELVDLNQKLVHARRSYDHLMADAANRRNQSTYSPQVSQQFPQTPQTTGPQYTQPAQYAQPSQYAQPAQYAPTEQYAQAPQYAQAQQYTPTAQYAQAPQTAPQAAPQSVPHSAPQTAPHYPPQAPSQPPPQPPQASQPAYPQSYASGYSPYAQSPYETHPQSPRTSIPSVATPSIPPNTVTPTPASPYVQTPVPSGHGAYHPGYPPQTLQDPPASQPVQSQSQYASYAPSY